MEITTSTAVHIANDPASAWTPLDFRVEITSYARGVGFVGVNEFLLSKDSAKELIAQLQKKLDTLENR